MTLSTSSLTRTKFPTANCDDEEPTGDEPPLADAALEMVTVEEDAVEEGSESALSELSGELLTLVKIAGLNVHLKQKQVETLWSSSDQANL